MSKDANVHVNPAPYVTVKSTAREKATSPPQDHRSAKTGIPSDS